MYFFIFYFIGTNFSYRKENFIFKFKVFVLPNGKTIIWGQFYFLIFI